MCDCCDRDRWEDSLLEERMSPVMFAFRLGIFEKLCAAMYLLLRALGQASSALFRKSYAINTRL